MMNGARLIGIGVGPGDPGLVTLNAIAAIKAADPDNDGTIDAKEYDAIVAEKFIRCPRCQLAWSRRCFEPS